MDTRCRRCGHELVSSSQSCNRCGWGAESGSVAATQSEIHRTVARSWLRSPAPTASAGENPEIGPDRGEPTTEPSPPVVVRSQPPVEPARVAQQHTRPEAGDGPPPSPQGLEARSSAAVAPLGQRFLAQLLDGGIVMVLYVAGWLVSLPLAMVATETSSYTTYQFVTLVAALMPLTGFVIGLALYVVGVGRLGQSIGKRTLGVRVQDLETGEPIGMGRSVVRWLVLGLMAMPCYLGYVTFFTDGTSRNRALHDKAASDVVVSTGTVPFRQSVRHVVGALVGRS